MKRSVIPRSWRQALFWCALLLSPSVTPSLTPLTPTQKTWAFSVCSLLPTDVFSPVCFGSFGMVTSIWTSSYAASPQRLFWLPVQTLAKAAVSLCMSGAVPPLSQDFQEMSGDQKNSYIPLHLLTWSALQSSSSCISFCVVHVHSLWCQCDLDESPEHIGSSLQYDIALNQTDSQVPLELAWEEFTIPCEVYLMAFLLPKSIS